MLTRLARWWLAAELEAMEERIDAAATSGAHWREAHERDKANHDQAQLNLITQLREVDQLVYRGSQCTSWEALRPIFGELVALCAKRQRAESDRVRDLLVPELKKVYTQPPTIQSIPSDLDRAVDRGPRRNPRLLKPNGTP